MALEVIWGLVLVCFKNKKNQNKETKTLFHSIFFPLKIFPSVDEQSTFLLKDFFHSFHIFWDCYCLLKNSEDGYFPNKTKDIFIALWRKSLTYRTFFMSMKICKFPNAQNT